MAVDAPTWAARLGGEVVAEAPPCPTCGHPSLLLVFDTAGQAWIARADSDGLGDGAGEGEVGGGGGGEGEVEGGGGEGEAEGGGDGDAEGGGGDGEAEGGGGDGEAEGGGGEGDADGSIDMSDDDAARGVDELGASDRLSSEFDGVDVQAPHPQHPHPARLLSSASNAAR